MNISNNMITSNEQFISTIVPHLEQIIPDYLCDGVLPYPMGIYVEKNSGEYMFGLLDTLSNGEIQSSTLDESSLVLMALYFGIENGEHQFSLFDVASNAEGVCRAVEYVPLRNDAVGPY